MSQLSTILRVLLTYNYWYKQEYLPCTYWWCLWSMFTWMDYFSFSNPYIMLWYRETIAWLVRIVSQFITKEVVNKIKTKQTRTLWENLFRDGGRTVETLPHDWRLKHYNIVNSPFKAREQKYIWWNDVFNLKCYLVCTCTSARAHTHTHTSRYNLLCLSWTPSERLFVLD